MYQSINKLRISEAMGDATPKTEDRTEKECRPYQLELIEQIKNANSILFLPTGSGKTFIALKIIEHLKSDFLKKSVAEGAKKTFFLVNTVALVDQHSDFINKNGSNFRVTPLRGSDGVDMWKSDEWHRIEHESDVIVLTSQVYLNGLQHAYLHIKNANLLIFDECHHAVKKHPMKEIMDRYEQCEGNQRPKILGLSATLLNSNTTPALFKKELQDLEETFDAKIITSKRVAEVKEFSTKPEIHFQRYKMYSIEVAVREKLEKIIAEHSAILSHCKVKEMAVNRERGETLLNDAGKNRIKTMKNVFQDIMIHASEFGLYFGYEGCICYLVQLYRLMIEKKDDEPYMNIILFTINTVKVVRKILALEISSVEDLSILGGGQRREVIKSASAVKFSALLHYLHQLAADDKCIVFVERRMTAKILYHMVKDYFEGLNECNVNVDFIIGYNNHPLRNNRETNFTKRNQDDIMIKFRRGELNVLIASNVLEEGIDLPDCNKIYMYDFPKTFRSYVQSKGRARKADSSFTILCDKDTGENEKKLYEFDKLELALEEVIQEKDIMAFWEENGNDEDDENAGLTYETKTGACMTPAQAVSAIDRYCAILPHDIFTTLTPYWWKVRDEDMVYCKLELPLSAAIKEKIVGPKRRSVKAAKQATALYAIRELHLKGALNEHLMPEKYPKAVFDESYWFPNWKNDEETITGADGTKKLIRTITTKVPKYLENCGPEPLRNAYLHVIRIIPKCENPTKLRRKVCFDLISSWNYEFGILTKNELPPVCNFPVYSDVGELEINIQTNVRTLQLEEEELEQISQFHRVLFIDVLQVLTKCAHYDKESKTNDYLVVPAVFVTDKYKRWDIAWNVIQNKSTIKDHVQPDKETRQRGQYKIKDYVFWVVIPWYRTFKEKLQYFVVTQVSHLTLNSEFPNADYATFGNYFKRRYELEALRPEQNLIEIRPITHHLDCLNMRVSGKVVKEEPNMFVAPEFCIRQDFPSVYWYKSTILPSVLHRLNYILLAEEIREKIAQETCIGEVNWKKDASDKLQHTKMNTPSLKSYSIKKLKSIQKEQKENGHVDLEFPTDASIKTNNKIVKPPPKDIEREKNIEYKDIEYHYKYFNYTPNYIAVGSPRRVNTTVREQAIRYIKKLSDKRKLPEIIYETPPSLRTLKTPKNYKGPKQQEIVEALTPKCCGDIMHLERLETLGDSFLKFAVSFAIYKVCNNANEGHLTTLKGRLLGNRNLLYCGNKLDIGAFVKMVTFSPYFNFLPPRFNVAQQLRSIVSTDISPSVLFKVEIPRDEQYSGDISQPTLMAIERKIKEFAEKEELENNDILLEKHALLLLNKQRIQDKTVADIMEALIGVYVQTGGLEPGFQLLQYFGVLDKLSFDGIFGKQSPSPLLPNCKVTIERVMPYYRDLEKLLDYEFRDKAYLVQALTHPSYSDMRMTDCYQKLEFIGDAILDFLITSYIFQECGNLSPGELTDLRSSLVNNNTFGALTVRLKIHKFMLHNNSKQLAKTIAHFVEYQEGKNYEIYGNELMKLISDDDTKIAEEVDIPKALGDIFESLAGAIFLDSGHNIQTVWRIYYNIMKNELKKFSESIPINPIRALYESNVKFKFFPAKTDKPWEPKETGSEAESAELRYTSDKIRIPLAVYLKANAGPRLYIGQGKTVASCKRAAAKLAIKDLGYTEFVI